MCFEMCCQADTPADLFQSLDRDQDREVPTFMIHHFHERAIRFFGFVAGRVPESESEWRRDAGGVRGNSSVPRDK